MKISNKTFDAERALYNLVDSEVHNCIFDGDSDGESALKECKNVALVGCKFCLRYPLWHTQKFALDDCQMENTCRAPMWYDADGKVTNSKIHGTKAVRECENMFFDNCDVNSAEFGWKCNNITLKDTTINAEYILFMSKNVTLDGVKMTGKYSFQYVDGATVTNCVLDTKDAFWHANNVTVKNCIVKGEYLGWYSNGLTFENCQIIGTQPLCYCQNLKLVNCTMHHCDLAFEYSQVNAQVVGHIHSVKNVKEGTIVANSIGQIVNDNSVMQTNCKITILD